MKYICLITVSSSLPRNDFLSSPGYCLEYAAILDKEAKPYKVDPFVIMVKFLLG